LLNGTAVKRKAWKILYYPEAVFTHGGGQSVKNSLSGIDSPFGTETFSDTLTKHHSGRSCSELGLLRMVIVVGVLFRALFHCLDSGLHVFQSLKPWEATGTLLSVAPQ